MIKLPDQPVTPSVRALRQFVRVAPVEPVDKDRQEVATSEKPFVERRKKNDRRNRFAARGPYDSRAGMDRRKDSRPGGGIEVDA